MAIPISQSREHRQTEGKLGTSGIELEHGNSTQGKMGVEVGYSKGDFNIAAGTEAEIGKLKSSSENLKAESMEVKNYLKAGIGETSEKVSRDILTGGIEIEGESGEEKFKFGEKIGTFCKCYS